MSICTVIRLVSQTHTKHTEMLTMRIQQYTPHSVSDYKQLSIFCPISLHFCSLNGLFLSAGARPPPLTGNICSRLHNSCLALMTCTNTVGHNTVTTISRDQKIKFSYKWDSAELEYTIKLAIYWLINVMFKTSASSTSCIFLITMFISATDSGCHKTMSQSIRGHSCNFHFDNRLPNAPQLSIAAINYHRNHFGNHVLLGINDMTG